MDSIMQEVALVEFWHRTETAATVPTQEEIVVKVKAEVVDDAIDWSSLAALGEKAKRDGYYYRNGARQASMSDLIGKVCIYVAQVDDEQIIFVSNDGTFAKMYHRQDCCESVSLGDVNGDLDDLIGVSLEVFEERTQDAPSTYGSATWTFYCLRTIRGLIDIRWHGSSNGYYSETADVDVWMPEKPIGAHQRIELLKAAHESGAS
ncbi:hypothetical protein IV89_001978 [Sulfitobacter sp. CB2047]|nr:hypothetical protein IV89_001978 [Sulfitobacter sp. CB2047]